MSKWIIQTEIHERKSENCKYSVEVTRDDKGRFIGFGRAEYLGKIDETEPVGADLDVVVLDNE